jgi:MEMO1 family protein
MADTNSLPRLRPVEAFPIRMNGEDFVCLQDPQNLAEQPVFLNQTLVFLVSRMDGEHTLRDIQADYFRASGDILSMEDLESLVNQLDEQHYLDGPRFESFYRTLVTDFQNAPSRPTRHAGTAYEAGHEPLLAQLASYFAHPEGPGTELSPDPSKRLRGLISPHIDFSRGGPTYAHAYATLTRHPGADTFVIFGTCHTPMPQRFSIGSKDYDTPLGPARIDQEFVSRLSRTLNGAYSHEFPHRGEHSIEFQAVCLKYVFGEDRAFRIVPILVGSFHDLLTDGKDPAQDPEIRNVVEAVRELAGAAGALCVVAGADLAHVGRRFGDPSGPSREYLREVEREDRRFLELVEKGDSEGVFKSIAADRDRRRVCGYPPIYMTLRCIDRPQGELLQYRQWADLDAGAAVTYAALAIF